jgi:hypothetical protein
MEDATAGSYSVHILAAFVHPAIRNHRIPQQPIAPLQPTPQHLDLDVGPGAHASRPVTRIHSLTYHGAGGAMGAVGIGAVGGRDALNIS